MQFEVEQKFRVDGFGDIEAKLGRMTSELTPASEQLDCYFAHPARDFGVTDEAFRLRSSGESNFVTYKGPRIDQTTKTRQELELLLPDGAPYRSQFITMLEVLGFRLVAEVVKTRRKAFVIWEGSRVEVSLDDVRDVGTFVELELLADEPALAESKQRLSSLAERLGLSRVERRSYLGLLLDARPELRRS